MTDTSTEAIKALAERLEAARRSAETLYVGGGALAGDARAALRARQAQNEGGGNG